MEPLSPLKRMPSQNGNFFLRTVVLPLPLHAFSLLPLMGERLLQLQLNRNKSFDAFSALVSAEGRAGTDRNREARLRRDRMKGRNAGAFGQFSIPVFRVAEHACLGVYLLAGRMTMCRTIARACNHPNLSCHLVWNCSGLQRSPWRLGNPRLLPCGPSPGTCVHSGA